MKWGDIIWIIIIAIGINMACFYSDIKGPIVWVFVVGGYFIYVLRKSIFHLLDEIEKFKSEKK